ncbi:MAG TPA: cob(I)yrinic acid a,c-diamide adenosyltransferase [Verrucomicrobiales bacterium]|nr:cob(I)yrinic acid a,c-diamide adenosyltransferase [Verrucomicrobiales bacterium]
MKCRRCMEESFVVDGSEGKGKMTRAMSITTKRGDKGFTDLLFGGKASKGDPQIEALGAVDELNANLGIARVLVDGEVARAIDQIQEWLVTLMGELAMPMGKEIEYEKSGFGRISTIEIEWLEDWSASIEKEEKFKGWLRPGERGGEVSARIHLARTVARRAERRTWDVVDEVASAEVRIFLNRLSDALWLLASASEKL